MNRPVELEDDAPGHRTLRNNSWDGDPYEITVRPRTVCSECTQRMMRDNAAYVPDLSRIVY